MRCYKRGGPMYYEKFYGHSDRFFRRRCIICGEIVDQVIFENRHEKRQ